MKNEDEIKPGKQQKTTTIVTESLDLSLDLFITQTYFFVDIEIVEHVFRGFHVGIFHGEKFSNSSKIRQNGNFWFIVYNNQKQQKEECHRIGRFSVFI